MQRKLLRLAAGILLVVPGGTIVSVQSRPQVAPRPLLLATERYQCLVRYADRLAVSLLGNVVDISACPPRIKVGFTPDPQLMDNYLTLSPADIQCLLDARKPGKGIAFRRGQQRVAIYLRPCGVRR